MNTTFVLPMVFDFGACFCFALTGAWAATGRGYDLVGAFVLAFVTGLGGGLIRDGFLLSTVPVALQDPRYLFVVSAATLVAGATMSLERRVDRLMAMVDALGLGAYAVVGLQKSLAAGLPLIAALVVGVTNAVGGGLLRDIIVRDEPLILRPGQLYALAALAGCLVFVAGVKLLEWDIAITAWIGVSVTFTLRMLAILFNWKTGAIRRDRVEPRGDDDPRS